MARFFNKFDNSISDNLRIALNNRGMSAYELSLYTDVSLSYIYKLLNGTNVNPSKQCLQNLADALGTTIDELI